MTRSEITSMYQKLWSNVLGFHQFLYCPKAVAKLGTVRGFQHRAYMLGSGLKLADLVLLFEAELRLLYPAEQSGIDTLKRQADQIQLIASMTDGEDAEKLDEKLHDFAVGCIRFFHEGKP